MKKFIGLVLFLALGFGLTEASVVVKTDKGSRSYPDGSTLNINAEKDMKISFYGLTVNVKKGEKVSLQCLIEDGEPVIYVKGDNMDNLGINGNDFVSSRNAAMKVNAKDGSVEVVKGKFEVTDKKGNTAFLKKGSQFKLDVYSDPTVDVNREQMNDTEHMETERSILSPSAPR